MPQLNHANHVGLTHAQVGDELRFTVSAVTDLMLDPKAFVKVYYSNTNTRWQYADGTAVSFTSRVCSIGWEGTSAQIPAQGVGVTDFRTGDIAFVRATTL